MIAHFDLDAFFASCEIRDHPELAQKPVVVGFVTPQGNYCNRGVVSAASYKAREYGIRSGMSLWEAKKRCPKLVVISGNFAKYEDSSNRMYDIFAQYTPYVEPLSLDEAFLDFAGCEAIYPDLIKICLEIKTKIKSEIGITCSCGIASSKVVAKIASDFKKPDGLTYVKYGEEAEFLAPLTIDRLYGVGPKLESLFLSIGVKTISDLASLPYEFIKEVLGKYGQTIWSWANGQDNRKLILESDIKSVGRSTTFTKNSNDFKFIKTNLYYLCEKIANVLRSSQLKAYRVSLDIRYQNFASQSHQRTFKHSIVSAKEIFQTACDLLQESWDKKNNLRLVGVSVSLFDNSCEQLSLFDNPTRRRVLESSLDKLRQKYGFWVVRPASLLNLETVKKLPDQEKPDYLNQWTWGKAVKN